MLGSVERHAGRARSLVAALLLAGCTGQPPAPPPPPPAPPAAGRVPAAAPAFAERLPDLPVENAACMAEGLYRGAQPDSRGLRALKERGVKTILCLRNSAPEEKEAADLGLEFVHIPMEAGLVSTPPTEEQVRRFFEVVLDPARRPVFFHCARGKDRTGTMAALYRIEVDGWTARRAMAEADSFGFHEWYRDLEDFIEGYRPRGFRPPAPR
jgi:protein tyrosine phosphatase (PTP) superfamily phosphohydrolase (DUF442 family)